MNILNDNNFLLGLRQMFLKFEIASKILFHKTVLIFTAEVRSSEKLQRSGRFKPEATKDGSQITVKFVVTSQQPSQSKPDRQIRFRYKTVFTSTVEVRG